MKLTVESMGLNYYFTVVAGTGMASEQNFTMMDEFGMKYIVPLKRNTTEIMATELNNRENYRVAFAYNGRPVIAYEVAKLGYRVIVFRDESMRSKEMPDFINRLEKNISILEKARKKEGFRI
ncbi:MAG: hypothetical protein LBU69_03520 [Deltaproteobacteria bacterium]|jgi:transposase|nr:hypothetical protein [Deltaproteobacteria bacterium]